MSEFPHWLVNSLQRFRGGVPGLARLGFFLASLFFAASGLLLTAREVGYAPLALDYLPLRWVAIVGAVFVVSAVVGAFCLLVLVVPSAYGWAKSKWNTPRCRFARLTPQEQLLCLSFFNYAEPELWMDGDDPVVMSLVEKGVLTRVGKDRRRLADSIWVGFQEDASQEIEAARSTDSFNKMLKKIRHWQEHHPTWMSQ